MKALVAITLAFGFLVGDMTTNDGAWTYRAMSFCFVTGGKVI